MKKLIVILAAMLLLTACSQPAATNEDRSLQNILDKQEFVLGFTQYPPLGYLDNNNPVGFDIDIAKEVMSRLGVTLKFQYIDWDAKTLELNSGNIDAIWNGLTITDERKLELTFSRPYLNNRLVILSLNSNPVENIAALQGTKVGVEISSSGQFAIEKDTALLSSLNEMIQYQTITEALLDLQAGGIDAIVADEVFARYAISKNADNYFISDDALASEQYGIGFRLNELALANRIDEILDEMVADGTAARISEAWFGDDVILR